jgi:hypothetical protein
MDHNSLAPIPGVTHTHHKNGEVARIEYFCGHTL